jgi:hypothetical protein
MLGMLIVAYSCGDFDLFEIKENKFFYRETTSICDYHYAEIVSMDIWGDFCVTVAEDR